MKPVEDVGSRGGQHALCAIEVLDRDRDAVERQGLARGKPMICRIGHCQRPFGGRRDVGVERLDLADRVVVGGRQLAGGE